MCKHRQPRSSMPPAAWRACRVVATARSRAEKWHQRGVQECGEGKYKEAAETAANAPNGALRTQSTITRLQQAPTVAGQKSPLIVYFGALLQRDTLNAIESVEMSRIALSQNRPDLVTNWMRDSKLTPSEPLGDLLKDVRARTLGRRVPFLAGLVGTHAWRMCRRTRTRQSRSTSSAAHARS